MISIITRSKHKGQYSIKGILILIFFALTTYYLLLTSIPAHAIVDPLASPNNKFGIHLISPTHYESSPAAKLVNSSGGDWGYVTILIESKDRDQNKWQNFFNDLRRRHLIPIVRLATQPDQGNWKLPYEGEEIAWADFLDNLIWPTKNRYVVIYNEPNHGQEWGGAVNARSYAQVLNKTIDALKSKNPDFFVLNAGFDASTPQQPPSYQDQLNFMQEMEMEIPGIFNKLDGWVSHSYPNPGFIGSPNGTGRGTVRTWDWELKILKSFGVLKDLPVFITETGWRHAEGIDYNRALPSAEVVGNYFIEAFQSAWNNPQIIAVTPFLLDYQQPPFDHFSFKKLTGTGQSQKILGATYPDYYPHYQAILNLPKNIGRPFQEKKAEILKGSIYSSVVAEIEYVVPLTLKNTGQNIWNDHEEIILRPVFTQEGFEVSEVKVAPGQKVGPGEQAIAEVRFKATLPGVFKTSLQLFEGSKAFDQKPFEFTTQVKAPVLLVINSKLPWKKDSSGEYLLSIASEAINSRINIALDKNGASDILEARFLLPDYNFRFTLHRPFYKSKTLEKQVGSGINVLDFGNLEPDFISVLLNPKELWKLLPFSN